MVKRTIGKLQSLGNLRGLLRRRALLFVTLCLTGLLITLAALRSLPTEYDASATLLIQQPPLHIEQRTAAAPNTGPQLQLLNQQMLSQESLRAIIAQFDLFNAPTLSDAQRLEHLRNAIRITPLSAPEPHRRQILPPPALQVTARMPHPVLAADVANALVTNLQERTRNARSAQTAAMQQYFDGEERRLSAAIATTEQQIAAFKRDHAVLLPGGLAALHTTLTEIAQLARQMRWQALEIEHATSLDPADRAQRLKRLQEDQQLLQIEAAQAKAALANTPRLQHQFGALERERTKAKAEYHALITAKAAADIQQMLTTRQNAETLTQLEKALPPAQPISSLRSQIAALGALLSLLLAFGVVLLRELRRPQIATAAQLEHLLGVAPIAVIPTVQTPTEQHWHKTKQRVSFSAVFFVFGGMALLFIQL